MYVNNTKRYQLSKKTKKKSLWQKEHPFWCHGYSSRWLQNNLSPQPSVLVALPFKLGVSLTEINVVFSALSIYLSSGCIDWKLNNEIVKKKEKNGLLKRSYNYLWLVVSVKCFFLWMKGVLFIFLLRLHWWRKKSVRKPVLCWHEFHLL